MTVLRTITDTLLRGTSQAPYRGGADKPADDDSGPRAKVSHRRKSSETAQAGGETPGDHSQAGGTSTTAQTLTGAGAACEAPSISEGYDG